MLPWLFPIGLIVVGLIFVTSSLSGTDQPDNIVAPPNVRDVTTLNAAAWAQRQVQPGVTSQVTGVVMVSSEATGTATYSIRAVIGRIDSPLTTVSGGTSLTSPPIPDSQVRSVVTCVAWGIDVSTGTIVEHGANQLSNTTGRHGLGDSTTLRNQCRSAVFAG